MRLYLKRKFAASHKLDLPYASKCGKLHGHTWVVEVWLEGPINEDGMVVDFQVIKEMIDTFDHTYLNDCIPFYNSGANPTAENLALFFIRTIPHAIQVRVWESEDAYAEEFRP